MKNETPHTFSALVVEELTTSRGGYSMLPREVAPAVRCHVWDRTSAEAELWEDQKELLRKVKCLPLGLERQ